MPMTVVTSPGRGELVDPAIGVLGVLGRSFDVHRADAPLVAESVPALEWGRLDGDGLRTAARELQRVISAVEHQQRLVLTLIDQRRAFAVDGSRDAADWAANGLGVSRKAPPVDDPHGLRASLAQRRALGSLR